MSRVDATITISAALLIPVGLLSSRASDPWPSWYRRQRLHPPMAYPCRRMRSRANRATWRASVSVPTGASTWRRYPIGVVYRVDRQHKFSCERMVGVSHHLKASLADNIEREPPPSAMEP